LKDEILQQELSSYGLQISCARPDESWFVSSVRTADGTTPIVSRRYLLFQNAILLLQSGQITRHSIDPENQLEVSRGNSRLTFFATDGNEYDVVARYNPQTNQIYPPN
jgi:hypothetical protein